CCTARTHTHRSRLCSRAVVSCSSERDRAQSKAAGCMSGRFGRAAVVVGWMLAAAACNPLDRFRPSSVNVPPRPLADDDEQLAWAEHEPWVVVVRKSCRTLDVYRYGARMRTFPAVFGLNGSGSKLYEGDLRTPSGLYMIVDKRLHPRWRQFLLLDYPNVQDLHRYWLAMERGGLPRRGDGYVGAGGAVGIHGTDKPGLNTRNVDWTWGCISLQNADVGDQHQFVPGLQDVHRRLEVGARPRGLFAALHLLLRPRLEFVGCHRLVLLVVHAACIWTRRGRASLAFGRRTVSTPSRYSALA